MAEAIITVRGEHTERYPAEQATVSALAQSDGPDRSEVLSRATRAADSLLTSIEHVHVDVGGPVNRWSSGSVRVWSERPWNSEGAQLPLVFHAVIDVTVVFRDVDAVGRWIDASAFIDDVSITAVEWDLTEENRTLAEREVRSRAVSDAVAKAATYAEAVGFDTFEPVAIADPGLLGDRPESAAPMPAMTRTAMKAGFDGGASPISLRPDEIVVSAAVDARFRATS